MTEQDRRTSEQMPSEQEQEGSVMQAARLSLMYLETGFVECEQCGNEVETKDTDATYTLNEALAALSQPNPEAGVVDLEEVKDLLRGWYVPDENGVMPYSVLSVGADRWIKRAMKVLATLSQAKEPGK